MKILFTLLLSLPLSLRAQTMPDLLKQMPEGISTLLTHNNVLDMIDLHHSLMKAEVQNRLGGQSTLEEITADYALIRTTAASTMTLKLLPTKATQQVICCINTVYVNDSIGESTLQFYTTKWTPLPSKKFITLPASSDSFCSITLSPSGTDLIIKQHPLPIPTFDGEKPQTAPTPVVYTWAKGKYKSTKLFNL